MVAFDQQLQKIRGIRTSGFLFTFWLLLVILAIPQLRFEIRRFGGTGETFTFVEYNYISYIVYFSLITVMLFLNCWADKEPRISDFKKASNPSPELRSSYLRQIFFQWFDKTTWVGYRRALEEKDIYDINPVDTSKELVPPFDKYFYESVEKNRR